MKKQPIKDKVKRNRIIRGGSHEDSKWIVSFRWDVDFDEFYHIGFRIVRNKPSEKQ